MSAWRIEQSAWRNLGETFPQSGMKCEAPIFRLTSAVSHFTYNAMRHALCAMQEEEKDNAKKLP